ncbi:MAG: hypothetical protein QRY72_01300 [Candidatus Rhabdochlamydia sp.]
MKLIMGCITQGSELRKYFLEFQKSVIEAFEDPVNTGPFVHVVTLFPCGHHLSQDVAKKIFDRNRQCPLDKQTITAMIPNKMIEELTTLLDHNCDHFYVKFLAAFKKNHPSFLKAITLFPCGHSFNEEIIKPSVLNHCPLDHALITNYAPNYTLRDLAIKIQEYEKNISLFYQDQSLAYLQMINPYTCIEELEQIPQPEFYIAIRQDSMNSILHYNLSRVVDDREEILINDRKENLKKALLEKTLSLEPEFAQGYYELALLLENEINPQPQAEIIVQKTWLLAKTIQYDPYHAKAYLCLAIEWQDLDYETLEKHFSLSHKNVFIQAIHLNPPSKSLYIHLGYFLQKQHDTLMLLDQTVLDVKTCFLRAMSLDPDMLGPYSLQCKTLFYAFRISKQEGIWQEYLPQIHQMFCDLIVSYPTQSMPYSFLALTLINESRQVTFHDGTIMTQKDLLLKAIDLDPHDPIPYTLLATLLQADETITLLNHQRVNKKQLALAGAQKQSTADSFIYFNMAQALSPSEVTVLPDGSSKSQAELLGMAFNLEISSSSSAPSPLLEQFIKRMSPKQTVQFEDKSIKTARDIYQMIIQKYPTYFLPYYHLGALLAPEEKITLRETLHFDQQALFIEAIRLNPDYVLAYQSLWRCLPKGKIITLAQGKKMGEQQLLLQIIRLSPQNVEAYYHLAQLLAEGKTVEIVPKEKWNKIDLLLKVLTLQPLYAKAYHALAKALPMKSCIQLPTGEKKNRLELYLKAFELNPGYETHSVMLQAFTPFIQKKEPLLLSNGKTLPFLEFMHQIHSLVTPIS